jgi:hypothetical protein
MVSLWLPPMANEAVDHSPAVVIGESVAIGPCRLLQIKRAVMADAAAVGVGEAAAIEEL